VDDARHEDEIPAEELAAVSRALAALGSEPLPAGVAERLDSRLAAELSSSPLAERRSRRRRLRIGTALGSAAAAAAVIVLALSWGGGGGHPPVQQAASALRDSAAGTAPVMAKTAADSGTQTRIESAPAMKKAPTAKKCAPASRKAGDRPRAACPGARGGHARAV
jgi:hypothetical protein